MFLFIKSFPRLWKATFKDLNRHFSITLSSVFSISVALFIAMLMAVAALNLEKMASMLESEFTIQVSVSSSLDDSGREQLGRQIRDLEAVSSAAFSDKDQELQALIEENGSMFEQYEGDANPLYDVFQVRIRSLQDITATEKAITAMSGVVSVDYGGKLILTLMEIVDGSRLIGFLLVAVMLVLAFFLIRASVRMAVGTRADEIAVMRQVGASNWYVLTPFVLEGILIGALGALIPGLILFFGYPVLYAATSGNLVSDLLELIPPQPFCTRALLILLAAGILVGMTGSWSGASKYLREVR